MIPDFVESIVEDKNQTFWERVKYFIEFLSSPDKSRTQF